MYGQRLRDWAISAGQIRAAADVGDRPSESPQSPCGGMIAYCKKRHENQEKANAFRISTRSGWSEVYYTVFYMDWGAGWGRGFIARVLLLRSRYRNSTFDLYIFFVKYRCVCCFL